MIRFFKASLSLAVPLFVSPLLAQKSLSIQRLDQHFVGVWVGLNHDYTETPEHIRNLTVAVVEDTHKHRLRMEYTYSDPGSSIREHYTRFFSFEPATDTVYIDRMGYGGKQRQRADGLGPLLKTGYGDFTLHATVRYKGDNHALERAEYHLSTDSWRYELYVSAFGSPFVQTLACSLNRADTTP